jgi:hypothetical protein
MYCNLLFYKTLVSATSRLADALYLCADQPRKHNEISALTEALRLVTLLGQKRGKSPHNTALVRSLLTAILKNLI